MIIKLTVRYKDPNGWNTSRIMQVSAARWQGFNEANRKRYLCNKLGIKASQFISFTEN